MRPCREWASVSRRRAWWCARAQPRSAMAAGNLNSAAWAGLIHNEQDFVLWSTGSSVSDLTFITIQEFALLQNWHWAGSPPPFFFLNGTYRVLSTRRHGGSHRERWRMCHGHSLGSQTRCVSPPFSCKLTPAAAGGPRSQPTRRIDITATVKKRLLADQGLRVPSRYVAGYPY